MSKLSLKIVWGFCIFSIIGDIAKWHLLQEVAAAMLVAALALDARLWVTRRNGKLALIILGGALFLAWSTGDTLQVLSGMAHYTPVISLLLCVSLIRLPMLESGIDVPLRGLLATVSQSTRPRAVIAVSAVLAPILNLGALAFMSTFLKNRSRPDTMAPAAVTRGIGMSMLWAPSFAPIALVMAAFPGVSWGATLPIAATLLVGYAILGLGLRGEIDVGRVPEEMHLDRLWMAGGLIAVALCSGILLRVGLGAPLTAAVSMSGVMVLVSWLLATRARQKDWSALVSAHIGGVWQAVIAESAVFAASGALAEALMQPRWFSDLSEWLAFLNQPTWVPMGLMILGIPALAVLGLHPIVPFSILAHAVTAEGLGVTAPVLYMTWVVIWILSLLVSPVSALNLSATAAFGVPSWRIGFHENWRFGLALGVAALCVLRLWSN